MLCLDNFLRKVVIVAIFLPLASLPTRAVSSHPGPFHDACAPGSGSTSVFGRVFDFIDYLADSGGTCYFGSLILSDFGNIETAALYGNFLAMSQNSFPPQFAVGPTIVETSISLVAYEVIEDGATLNFTVSGPSGLPDSFASFWEWSAASTRYGNPNYVVTTTSTPAQDSECIPAVVTTSLFPQGPTCNVPADTQVNSFVMTNTLSNGWIPGGVISNTFVHANTLPPAGLNPSEPLLPPRRPVLPNEPWRFPAIWVGRPIDVFWLDPEVAIGYIYNVEDPSGPLFDQFIAPDLPFNDQYELFANGGPACSSNPDDFTIQLATITQDVPFDFTTPLACFAIKGIDEQNALDPTDTNAFLAGVSFDKTGLVNVNQTPIPTPGPLPMAGAGMAYSWARQLRQRLRAARQPFQIAE